MIWCYRLIFLPILLLALPYYAYRMWRRGGYGKDFEHRFGCFHKLPAPAADKHRIWLQAVSVGEILAVGPLIEALNKDPRIEIVLTTTTSTGYAEARKRYAEKVLSIGVFPLDFWLFSKITWDRIQPNCLILTESELWPEHLHRAKKTGTPAYLVNARISDRSFGRYQKVAGLAARMLSKFDQIFAASDLDHERLSQLGAPADRVTVSGNIKFDVPVRTILNDTEKETLRQELGFPPNAFVLIGASTWPGEESVLLNAQQLLINSGLDCRLLIVPRHAERAPEIVRILESQPLSWHQRSKATSPQRSVHIHLADTTGELATLCQAAHLAFIGKSLPPNNGGQTPIEAAGLGIPELLGPNMQNFRAVVKSLVQAGAAVQVETTEELMKAINTLALDSAQRNKMQQAGLNWHQQNRGSSQRIADVILARIR